MENLRHLFCVRLIVSYLERFLLRQHFLRPILLCRKMC
uniref:Uncharacterized protein n=1 Tax=Brassica campestris TaxID=3711 RepID=A0A3P6D801_BRACM|nr:unnamed protein product [Brassica rapa]